MSRRKEIVEEADYNKHGSNVDADGVQVSSTLSADGRYEYPDPVPMQPPVGYQPEPSITELIRMFVRRELSQQVADEYDTFEEAEDFDIEDDPADPLTPYEKVFDPPKPLIPDVPKDTPLKVDLEPAVASPPAGPPESSPAQSLLDTTVLGDTKKDTKSVTTGKK